MVRWWGEREWLRFRSRRTGDDLRRGDGERDLRLGRDRGTLTAWGQPVRTLTELGQPATLSLCTQGHPALPAARKVHKGLHFLLQMSNKNPNPLKTKTNKSLEQINH